MEASPALQTSSVPNQLDISDSETATHVYVKVDEPRGLSPRFEGPYAIVSRPSRSQIEVRVGSYANGSPRTLVVHWSSCKVAHVRKNFQPASRPNIGRRSRPDPPTAQTLLNVNNNDATSLSNSLNRSDSEPVAGDFQNNTPVVTEPAEIQTAISPPSVLHDSVVTSRPIRSTRNPKPSYIDSMSAWQASPREIELINASISAYS